MADELAQLPTTLDPQRLAALQSLFPQQQAQPVAAPATAPPADITQEMVEASRAGRQAFGEERQTSLGLQQQIADLLKQQQSSVPSLAFHPNFHGGFLHNLGQGLLTLGAATRPGQNVENVIYREPREEYESRAQKIKTLQGEQEESEKRGSAAAGMVSKPITAAGAALRGEAAQSTAATKALAEKDRHNEQLTRLEQNGKALGLKADALAALKQYHQAYLAAFDRRTAAQEDVAMAETGARRDAAAASNISKYTTEHPWLSMFGIGEPVAPAAAGTETPAAAAAKGAGKGAAKAGSTTRFVEGNTHYNIPAGQEAAFLKDHPNAKRQ